MTKDKGENIIHIAKVKSGTKKCTRHFPHRINGKQMAKNHKNSIKPPKKLDNGKLD